MIAIAASVLFAGTAISQTDTKSKTEQHSTDAAGQDGRHGHTYGGSGEATISSHVSSEEPPAIGKTSQMILTLKTKDGKPVPVGDLEVVHTEPIHLLIVDPSLGDYHHIHPKPMKEVGAYAFPFAPKKAGKYLVYCDLHPKATGIQEYSVAAIEVPGGSPGSVQKTFERKVTSDGYTFELKFDDPKLVQGKATGATVLVTGPDGKPFDKLEPVMGAFAHMVGFSDDRLNVAHIHPLGKEPEKAEERGGPELKFHVGLPHPGYHVLYSQVQINGKDVFAPFGVEVAPRQLPEDPKAIMTEVDETVERLDNVANFGPLHKVHELAFAARDLMMTLPEKAKDLDADKKQKLETALKRVKSLAGLLDKYGDNKDQEQTKALMPKFKAEVAAVHEIVGTSAKAGEDVKVLGNTKCPVSGMAVGSMEPGAALIHNGTKIGLCCNGCTQMFMKDPEAGFKKAQESAKK
ncbi:MAG: hypothetical protein ACR2IE_05825 [Candidatus Sumerlaeaceae bacterium]